MLTRRERLKRRLAKVASQAKAARADLAVLEQQLLQVREEAESARTRSIVSETPLDKHDEREAFRQLQALERGASDLRSELARLDSLQDELLDRLTTA